MDIRCLQWLLGKLFLMQRERRDLKLGEETSVQSLMQILNCKEKATLRSTTVFPLSYTPAN